MAPVWALATPLLRPDAAVPAPVAVGARGVAVPRALAPDEAAALVAAATAMGWEKGNAAVRTNEMCAIVVSDADAAELFRRVQGAVRLPRGLFLR